MKILLAVDGSKHSQWAEGLLRQLGGGHAVEVLYVTPAGGTPLWGAASPRSSAQGAAGGDAPLGRRQSS